MSEYDNTNRGALFKNDQKASENHPDYKGTINFNGVDCWLSAWLKKSKAGATYMSLSVKPKEGFQERDQSPEEPAFDDDVPF